MPIRITSKREGFRRCGIPHSARPTIYADDTFSKKDLKVLEEEPMLVVEKISLQEAKKTGWAPPEDETKEEQ